MLFVEFTHVGFAQGDGDAVDASFNAGTQVISLQGILRSKLASSFRDCISIRSYNITRFLDSDALSSCKLSINACFWPCVKRNFLAGGPLGVASGAVINSGDLRFKEVMVDIEEEPVVVGKIEKCRVSSVEL